MNREYGKPSRTCKTSLVWVAAHSTANCPVRWFRTSNVKLPEGSPIHKLSLRFCRAWRSERMCAVALSIGWDRGFSRR
jgi:hypothetical protein